MGRREKRVNHIAWTRRVYIHMGDITVTSVTVVRALVVRAPQHKAARTPRHTLRHRVLTKSHHRHPGR